MCILFKVPESLFLFTQNNEPVSNRLWYFQSSPVLETSMSLLNWVAKSYKVYLSKNSKAS